jgi:hypothetical protein
MSAAQEEAEEHALDAYEAADGGTWSPAVVAARLMGQLDELKHLVENDIKFLWLMRHTEHLQAGRQVLAMVHEPQVQGRLRELFEHLLIKQYGFLPDYVVTVDAQWWADATDLQREALVHHELMHVRQALDRHGEPRINRLTGEPIYMLVAHDIEEFNKTVERFGLWKGDVEQFARTCRDAEEKGHA